MSHGPRHCTRSAFSSKYTRAISGQRWPSVTFNSAGYNYNRSCGWCLGTRDENPLENNDLAQVQGRWRNCSLPPALSRKSSIILLIALPVRERNPFRDILPDAALRKRIHRYVLYTLKGKARGTTLDATLMALGAADLKVWSRRHRILYNSITFREPCYEERNRRRTIMRIEILHWIDE